MLKLKEDMDKKTKNKPTIVQKKQKFKQCEVAKTPQKICTPISYFITHVLIIIRKSTFLTFSVTTMKYTG
jgi:hypothetical protein